MDFLIIVLVFLLAALAGVPVAFSIGIASVVGFVIIGEDLGQVGSLVLSGMDHELLLAIPFYVLAGMLLARSGVINPLLEIFALTLGRFRGGMVAVTGASSVTFGGMTGSGPAEAAALSSIYGPPMEKAGYPRPFIGALCATGGTLGLVIPPSGGYIVYALVAGNVSISDLFIAGIVPGLLLTVCYVTVGVAVGRKYETSRQASTPLAWRSLVRLIPGAMLGLAAPVIILGGIYTGLTTVTESAFVAVVFALIVGLLVLRSMTLKDVAEVVAEAGVITGTIIMILAASSILSWVVSVTGWARDASGWLVDVAGGPTIFILLTALLFIVAGLFLDGNSLLFVLLPLVLPAASQLGVDPVHFAVVVVMSISIGLLTPPVGLDLFAAASVLNVSFESISRAVIPLVGAAAGSLILVILFPGLTHVLLK